MSLLAACGNVNVMSRSNFSLNSASISAPNGSMVTALKWRKDSRSAAPSDLCIADGTAIASRTDSSAFSRASMLEAGIIGPNRFWPQSF